MTWRNIKWRKETESVCIRVVDSQGRGEFRLNAQQKPH